MEKEEKKRQTKYCIYKYFLKRKIKPKLLVNLFSGKLEQLAVRLITQPERDFSCSS